LDTDLGLSRYIARLFGYGGHERGLEILQAERAEYEAAHPNRCPTPNIDIARNPFKPYGGVPVPRGTLLEGVLPDSGFLDNWREDWLVVPADNGRDALVFSTFFVAETSTGDVIYDEEDKRAEDLDFARRLADTIKIHERLESGREHCERVVKFRGSSPAYYRIERPPLSINWWEVPKKIKNTDAVLALHQRWALQYLSACRHAHAKGIAINAPPGQIIWLRRDLSLVVVAFVAASCQELDVKAGDWEDRCTSCSPFGLGDSQNLDPPYGVSECGQRKTDLFNWACWVYETMTERRNPLVPPEIAETDALSYMRSGEGCARGSVARDGTFDNWPVLGNERLGSCLVKAWKGQYESAEDALQDVRGVLKECGRVLAADSDDEIEAFDWEAEIAMSLSPRKEA
jgi:hypothetical protein